MISYPNSIGTRICRPALARPRRPRRGDRSRFSFVLARWLVVPCLTFAALGALPAAASPNRPNIVVLLSDDVGACQPGFQGGTAGVTPNMDRLAQGGARLTQFYTHATCTPTRSAFMTGRYPFRTGTEERFHANDTAGMLTDERTLGEALRDAGYFTAIIGKWHLGEWQKQHLPLQRGFQHQYGCYGGVLDSFTRRRGDVYDWHRNEQPLQEEGYSTFLIADEFARVLESHDSAQPFFFYVPLTAAHGPHDAPSEYVSKRNGDKQLAMLECLDVAVGRIVDALTTKGVLDNTLIVYFNDNGAIKRIGNGPFRGYKKTTYEGGVRMPCFWHWAGRIAPNTTVDAVVHVTDLYPTLVTLAGGSLAQPLPLDGNDLWPTITQGRPFARDEVPLSLPGHATSETGPPAIRVGKYKLVDGELYDLELDPYEQNDLAAEKPDVVQRLAERLTALSLARRPSEEHAKIRGARPAIRGEEENRQPPDWLAAEVGDAASARQERRRNKSREAAD